MVDLIRMWTFLLCVLGLVNNSEQLPDPFGYWETSYMEKGITIRLVRKDWKPLGPSGDTDNILDEYQWDVSTAFKSLLKSKYRYEEYPLKSVENIFQSAQYNKALDTIVIIHPILHSADSYFATTTITALSMRNLHKHYNIFAINLESIHYHMIIGVMKNALGLDPNYNVVAKVISPFLEKGIDGQYLRPEQIHFVGWSYSGHLIGYISRIVSVKYQRRISSIIALDPFTNEENTKLVHVSREDADVVHVYHTNSVLGGSRRRFGTADIVFNNGNVQPECRLRVRGLLQFFSGEWICSHLQVVQRFWYVILYPSKFISRRCVSWKKFTHCDCEEHPTSHISYPIKNREMEGIHYIRTSGTKPYGLGSSGNSCNAKLST